MTDATKKPATSLALPDDFQERVFKAIAVQRPAATAYIRDIRRRKPDATPAEVMKTIEQQYVATTTSASAAAGATATIPVVGIPVAIGLGVADLLFFYETTALFALAMAELRRARRRTDRVKGSQKAPVGAWVISPSPTLPSSTSGVSTSVAA